eukprot:1848190-Amphidinium_carterae.1
MAGVIGFHAFEEMCGISMVLLVAFKVKVKYIGWKLQMFCFVFAWWILKYVLILHTFVVVALRAHAHTNTQPRTSSTKLELSSSTGG